MGIHESRNNSSLSRSVRAQELVISLDLHLSALQVLKGSFRRHPLESLSRNLDVGGNI